MSSFAPVGSLLPDLLKQNKIEAATDRYTALHLWEEALTGFLSKTEGKTQATDLQDGILSIACLSPELAGEIKSFEFMIIGALNRLADKPLVTAIQIEI